MRFLRFGLLAVTALLAACAQHGAIPRDPLAAVAGSPPLLRAMLYQMPKGGDLHNHLSGAAYAEANIAAAAAAGRCVNPITAQVSVAPCKPGTRQMADALTDGAVNRTVVNAWSMRGFVPTGAETGHDHFFATFGLFGGAAPADAMAADVVDRAGAQHMRYIELMITFQGAAVSALADKVQKVSLWDPGHPASFHAALVAAGLPAIVAAARQDVAALERKLRANLQCDTSRPMPGCAVTVRWLQQVTRVLPPHRVFAASLFAALLQAAEPHVVGLNFVAPEDAPPALADYTAQMRMLDYLVGQMPKTNVTLHAGELTLGLVPPEALRFHIRQAVEIGHAKRIGHGAAVLYEDDAVGLLREMAARRVAVEINLTSNAQILGVEGAEHPFPIYLDAGVPVVLSTDDEGVERIDRTHELHRAVMTYRLDWPTLIDLERNTLEYAFVEGESLWDDTRDWRMVRACAGSRLVAEPEPGCAAFLKANTKAALQWSLERDLAAFRF